MDREALAAMLEAGRSIESIARETGKSASTVAYWVNKHGLTSATRRPARRARRDRARATRRRWSRKGSRSARSRHGSASARHDGPALAAEARTQDAAARYSRRGAPKPDRDPARMLRSTAGDPFVRVGGPGALPLRALQHRGRERPSSSTSRRSWSPRPAGAACSAGSTRYAGGRCNSTIAIRRRRPSRSAARESRDRSNDYAWRRGSACYCARTATRWSRPECIWPCPLLR